jgi:two-component system sensor histidine kinase MprB
VSLRGRLTVTSALIVGAILTVGAIVCFWVMRNELRGQVDDSLRAQAQLIRTAPAVRPIDAKSFLERIPQPSTRSGGPAPYVQFVSPSGHTTRSVGGDLQLPVDAQDLDVARGRQFQALRDRDVKGTHLRIITIQLRNMGALQLGRSLVSVDHILSRLRLALAILVFGGIVLATVLSRLFSRRVIAPISALTEATEHIEATGDLGRRVHTDRADEVGRLASRFNAMLERVQQIQDALEASTAAQRQLVADASHELRTPVAGLRTNIEVLLASRGTNDDDREALLADLVQQTEELSSVVSDLIELARGDQPPDHAVELDLGAIAEEALTRARRHAPHLDFHAQIEPWPMVGSPERLGRAVNNLLDNAAKFSTEGSTIELRAGGGELSVRDHGPGVAAEELPYLFDRFYRARSTNHLHGSGLGLAIVKQVVDAHGGTVQALPAEDGGLLVRVRFPSVASEEDARSSRPLGDAVT